MQTNKKPEGRSINWNREKNKNQLIKHRRESTNIASLWRRNYFTWFWYCVTPTHVPPCTALVWSMGQSQYVDPLSLKSKAEESKQEKVPGEKAQFHVLCPLPQRSGRKTGRLSRSFCWAPSLVNSSRGLLCPSVLPGTNCSPFRLALTTFLHQDWLVLCLKQYIKWTKTHQQSYNVM